MMETLSVAERSPPSLATGAPSRFAPFVVAVKSGHSTECDQPDCPVKLCTTLSLPHASALPASYSMLSDLQVQTLRRTYCRLHCSHAYGAFGAASPISPKA